MSKKRLSKSPQSNSRNSLQVKYDEQNSILHQIILNNDIDSLNNFELKSKELNQKNSNGDTPFHFAVRNKQVSDSKIREFVEKGAKLNTTNSNNVTPFYEIITIRKSIDLIHHCLLAGGDLKKVSKNGESVLFDVIRTKEGMKNLSLVKYLCEPMFCLMDLLLLFKKDHKIVKTFEKNFVLNLNQRNSEGDTFLHVMCKNKSLFDGEIFVFLLETNFPKSVFDMDTKNQLNETSFELMVKNVEKDQVKLYMTRKRGENANQRQKRADIIDRLKKKFPMLPIIDKNKRPDPKTFRFKRAKVYEEIYNTEAKYLLDINSLLEIYLEPLIRWKENYQVFVKYAGPESSISKDFQKTIQSIEDTTVYKIIDSIKLLEKINFQYLSTMKKLLTPSLSHNIFNLPHYIECDLVNQLNQSNPEFGKKIRYYEIYYLLWKGLSDTFCNQNIYLKEYFTKDFTEVQSLFAKLIQRLPRYVLLLRSLSKLFQKEEEQQQQSTRGKNQSILKMIELSVENVEEVLRKINIKKTAMRNAEITKEIGIYVKEMFKFDIFSNNNKQIKLLFEETLPILDSTIISNSSSSSSSSSYSSSSDISDDDEYDDDDDERKTKRKKRTHIRLIIFDSLICICILRGGVKKKGEQLITFERNSRKKLMIFPIKLITRIYVNLKVFENSQETINLLCVSKKLSKFEKIMMGGNQADSQVDLNELLGLNFLFLKLTDETCEKIKNFNLKSDNIVMNLLKNEEKRRKGGGGDVQEVNYNKNMKSDDFEKQILYQRSILEDYKDVVMKLTTEVKGLKLKKTQKRKKKKKGRKKRRKSTNLTSDILKFFTKSKEEESNDDFLKSFEIDKEIESKEIEIDKVEKIIKQVESDIDDLIVLLNIKKSSNRLKMTKKSKEEEKRENDDDDDVVLKDFSQILAESKRRKSKSVGNSPVLIKRKLLLKKRRVRSPISKQDLGEGEEEEEEGKTEILMKIDRGGKKERNKRKKKIKSFKRAERYKRHSMSEVDFLKFQHIQEVLDGSSKPNFSMKKEGGQKTKKKGGNVSTRNSLKGSSLLTKRKKKIGLGISRSTNSSSKGGKNKKKLKKRRTYSSNLSEKVMKIRRKPKKTKSVVLVKKKKKKKKKRV